MTSIDKNEWISSINILDKAGISRATLNNYIKMGIISKPVICKPYDPSIKAKKIGYFPLDVLEKIEKVKQLKKEGRSMKSIIDKLTYEKGMDYSIRERRNVIEKNIISTEQIINNDVALKLTIKDIQCPAYLLNNCFEVEWLNHHAEENIFNQSIMNINDVTSRNIFKLFSNIGILGDDQNRNELVDYHMSYLKSKYERIKLKKLYEGITEREVNVLEKIYDRVDSSRDVSIYDSYVNVVSSLDQKVVYHVFRIIFREGLLLIFAPGDDRYQYITELLSNRSSIISELLKNRLSTLVSFCVLVADMQDSTRICAELPPEEYLELIDQVWKCMESTFKNYYGTYGKHVGDGMVYFFLKNKETNYLTNAIYCSLELREKINKLNMNWKKRKGWLNNISINIGINEGQEYMVNIAASPNIEFTVLGDSVNYASRLSDIARNGSIWATKNVLNKLTIDERSKIRFGIKKKLEDREIFIESTFSRIMDMVKEEMSRKLKDIWTLPVTEIIDKVE